MNGSTGEYTFTPASEASCDVSIQVCDDNGAGLCSTKTDTIFNNATPTITSTAPDGVVGSAYSYTPTVTNNLPAPLAFSAELLIYYRL